MKPWPLAVRPEELRAIRRAFRRVLPSVLVGDGSEGLGSVPEGRRSELRPYREALLPPSPPPTGATRRGRPPRGGHPNTTSSGRGWLFIPSTLPEPRRGRGDDFVSRRLQQALAALYS